MRKFNIDNVRSYVEQETQQYSKGMESVTWLLLHGNAVGVLAERKLKRGLPSNVAANTSDLMSR